MPAAVMIAVVVFKRGQGVVASGPDGYCDRWREGFNLNEWKIGVVRRSPLCMGNSMDGNLK
jgi:hypothetical protein